MATDTHDNDRAGFAPNPGPGMDDQKCSIDLTGKKLKYGAGRVKLKGRVFDFPIEGHHPYVRRPEPLVPEYRPWFPPTMERLACGMFNVRSTGPVIEISAVDGASLSNLLDRQKDGILKQLTAGPAPGKPKP